jgi:hypothetical protein
MTLYNHTSIKHAILLVISSILWYEVIHKVLLTCFVYFSFKWSYRVTRISKLSYTEKYRLILGKINRVIRTAQSDHNASQSCSVCSKLGNGNNKFACPLMNSILCTYCYTLDLILTDQWFSRIKFIALSTYIG